MLLSMVLVRKWRQSVHCIQSCIIDKWFKRKNTIFCRLEMLTEESLKLQTAIQHSTDTKNLRYWTVFNSANMLYNTQKEQEMRPFCETRERSSAVGCRLRAEFSEVLRSLYTHSRVLLTSSLTTRNITVYLQQVSEQNGTCVNRTRAKR